MVRIRDDSERNITGEIGTLLRMIRSIQVEGAFSSIQNNQGFTQFLMRGIHNVKTEFLILSPGI